MTPKITIEMTKERCIGCMTVILPARIRKSIPTLIRTNGRMRDNQYLMGASKMSEHELVALGIEIGGIDEW